MTVPHPKMDLRNIFSYHPPTGDQPEHYEKVRAGALAFAEIIEANVPDGADKAASIRLLREAMMTANAAIALNGKL